LKFEKIESREIDIPIRDGKKNLGGDCKSRIVRHEQKGYEEEKKRGDANSVGKDERGRRKKRRVYSKIAKFD
jgi:hypothetical protein